LPESTNRIRVSSIKELLSMRADMGTAAAPADIHGTKDSEFAGGD
jgi:hypothetical protein